eukprot:318781-Prymnesium_polylepis.1
MQVDKKVVALGQRDERSHGEHAMFHQWLRQVPVGDARAQRIPAPLALRRNERRVSLARVPVRQVAGVGHRRERFGDEHKRAGVAPGIRALPAPMLM